MPPLESWKPKVVIMENAANAISLPKLSMDLVTAGPVLSMLVLLNKQKVDFLSIPTANCVVEISNHRR